MESSRYRFILPGKSIHLIRERTRTSETTITLSKVEVYPAIHDKAMTRRINADGHPTHGSHQKSLMRVAQFQEPSASGPKLTMASFIVPELLAYYFFYSRVFRHGYCIAAHGYVVPQPRVTSPRNRCLFLYPTHKKIALHRVLTKRDPLYQDPKLPSNKNSMRAQSTNPC
jgi:hypothetical protein